MIEPWNISMFNRFSVVLLQQLYEKFPRTIEVRAEDIYKPIISECEKLESPFLAFCLPNDVVEYLNAEDFITYRSRLGGGEGFSDVRLTSKGLALFDGVGASIDSSDSIVRIGNAEVTKEMARRMTGAVLVRV